MSVATYRDGSLWIVVETGMPEHSVQVGTGETLDEARASLEPTPIQSTGPDCGLASALQWAHYAGWISDPSTLEPVDALEPVDDA